MSDQLDDRIRVWMEHVVDEAPSPPDVPSEPRLPPRVRRPLPGWLVAVGVAVMVLVLIGGVGWLVGSENEWVADEPSAGIDVASSVPSPLGQTVGVTVSGVSGHAGDELAGVLYAGGELTDLDRDAVGGFWSVVSGDDFTTTEVVREPGDEGLGRFPFVSDAALTVAPGRYTLVLWVDTGLNPVSRWVPINTDGMGLFGCQVVLEVGGDAQTDVVVSPEFHPDGWNTDCATGVAIPGTDATAAVTPPGEATDTASSVATVSSTPGPGSTLPTVGEWNPILATTEAKQAPPAATCPAGSDPNAPGPVGQNRPQLAGYTSNQSAVFDRHTGRVTHVDDTGETWAFDVCTNTWEQLDPAVDNRGLTILSSGDKGELVYDVDSDATLLIRDGAVLVYNAAANEWVAQQAPTKTYGIAFPGLGAVYDPVSGLVVVQTSEHGLVAYDVDTNTWTEIGTLAGDYPDFLVGYSATADRLYFLGFQDSGVAVDPRTGRTEPLDQPADGVEGGFGAFEFATSTNTAYVFGNGVCRLDPTSRDWTCTGKPDIPRSVQNFESMVGDPINNRLLLFHGSCCGLYPTMHDDVWALDPDTGTWSLLLEEANRRLHE